MKRVICILERFGLTTVRRAEAAEIRAEKAESYAQALTREAEQAGDIIVGSDYSHVSGIALYAGARLIVPLHVKCVSISNCVAYGEVQP